MRKQMPIVIVVCIVLLISFFSGCFDIPEELTQMSIVSFEAEPNIINKGEFANISWVVINADTINIDNGIGTVALTGHRTVQPMQTTTYLLTISNATLAKSATVTITVKNTENTSGGGFTKAPNMAWNKQTTPTKLLTLVSADNGLTWDQFHIVGGTLTPFTTNVIAGQVITLNATKDTITITHIPSNTLMGIWTWVSSSGNRIAVIDTTMGTIRVQLYEDKMPITTENFIRLVNDGFYNGLIFHRIGDNFMIQSGGYYPNGTQKISPYGNIAFETSNVKHVDGAISMASTGAKVGGSAQLFICDGAQMFLDGNYAAFGVTIEGLDVVRTIAAQPHSDSGDGTGEPTTDIIINSITIVNS